MKDFTKTQEKRTDRVGAMKCMTCSYEVRSFGVQPGANCGNPDDPECPGKMVKIDDAGMDRAKMRSDANR